MKTLNREFFRNQRFLFVFDLDGTLLTPEQKISPLTANLIQELRDLGNFVTIASGRAERAIYPYYHHLGLHSPFICYNGAMIANPDVKDFPIFKKMIPLSLIQKFFTRFPKESFKNYMIEDETDQYYLRENKEFPFFFHPEGMRIHLGHPEDMKKDMMTMVVETYDTINNETIVDYIENTFPECSMRFWLDAPTFGELYYRSVNKSTSLDKIIKYYHLDREHVVAFGDAMNDAELLSKAGISFAMKNGAEPLKQMATYVTPEDNAHEGIYYALLDLFGKE